MTINRRPFEPPILVSYDSLDEKASAFVAQSLAAEVAAQFAPRDEAPFSILAYDGAELIGGLNGASHWGWRYIRQFWVAASWRGRGVAGASCKRPRARLARKTASVSTSILSIPARRNSTRVAASRNLAGSTISRPASRACFCKKSYSRREGWRCYLRRDPGAAKLWLRSAGNGGRRIHASRL